MIPAGSESKQAEPSDPPPQRHVRLQQTPACSRPQRAGPSDRPPRLWPTPAGSEQRRAGPSDRPS
eukprot:5704618-Pyramimonas_sp.AAC.1